MSFIPLFFFYIYFQRILISVIYILKKHNYICIAEEVVEVVGVRVVFVETH